MEVEFAGWIICFVFSKKLVYNKGVYSGNANDCVPFYWFIATYHYDVTYTREFTLYLRCNYLCNFRRNYLGNFRRNYLGINQGSLIGILPKHTMSKCIHEQFLVTWLECSEEELIGFFMLKFDTSQLFSPIQGLK